MNIRTFCRISFNSLIREGFDIFISKIKKAKCVGAVICVVAAVIVCGCAADNGMDRLTELLYSDYCTEIDFVLSDGAMLLEGSAQVTKTAGENVKISFLSPEEFAGMTVESGGDGQSGNLYFSYYGMRLPLPDNALTKVNLVMSFFSDETALALSSLRKSEITDFPDYSENSDVKAKRCCFNTFAGDVSACVIYDASGGTPLEFSAASGIYTAQVVFKKINNP